MQQTVTLLQVRSVFPSARVRVARAVLGTSFLRITRCCPESGDDPGRSLLRAPPPRARPSP